MPTKMCPVRRHRSTRRHQQRLKRQHPLPPHRPQHSHPHRPVPASTAALMTASRLSSSPVTSIRRRPICSTRSRARSCSPTVSRRADRMPPARPSTTRLDSAFCSAPTPTLRQVILVTKTNSRINATDINLKRFAFDLFTGALTTSQFPVFTLYVQKNCLRITPSSDAAESVTDGRGALRISPSGAAGGQRSPLRPQRQPTSRAEAVGANTICNRAWSFERVQGFELESVTKRRRRVANRQACEEFCLGERDFTCRLVHSGDLWGSTMSGDVSNPQMRLAGDECFTHIHAQQQQ